ncbi:MAG: SDR family oxidoreductase [Deltaproteobacteria bacterium]|nr:SDR family oxidoreductase [Deltaproteobacteria bacterium]
MKTLITGGAGFLGSHLCERFIKDGHDVVCVDNLLTGSRRNVSHLEDEKGFEFVLNDVSEHLDLDGDLDNLLHFACPASPVDYMRHPIETMKVEAMGTHNALKLAQQKGATFLLASTSEVYGDPLTHPQPETYWGNVNPIGPRSVYDEGKRYAEAMTMAWHRTHGLETRIVRIFNTYGPRMQLEDGRVVPAFVSQVLRGKRLTVFGDGGQTRSFCYVDDLVEGIVRLLNSGYSEPVNIGNPTEFTIAGFAELVQDVFGIQVGIEHLPLPEDDPKVRRPDITRAREILGWEPRISLEEGLRLSADYFRDEVSRIEGGGSGSA